MGVRSLFLFGMGQVGINLLARFFFQWLIRFADVGKDTAAGPLLAASLVGALFFGFRIFDGVTDPLAGILGDRWVASGKERRSLIWVSFLIPPVGLALVFAPDQAMPESLRYLLLTAGMFLFFVGYTLYAIPYWSLVEDYSQGNEETRTSLSNALGVGILLATGIGFVLSPPLVEAFGFFWGSLIFGAVGTVLMTFPYFAAPARATVAQPPPAPTLLESLGASLTHKRFLAVILLFSGAQMSLTMMTAAAPYIAENLLGGNLSDVALLLGPFLLAAIPTFFFVPKLSRRTGWEKAAVLGVVALSIAYMGAAMLGKTLIGTPLITAMLVFACAGPGSAFVLGLEAEAIARSAQKSTHKSTGVYFGIYNFIVKALNGLALFLTGILAEQGTMWSVRAMPMIAGGLCVVGVMVYLFMEKTDPVLEGPSEGGRPLLE